ncbi:MAG TPA: amidohydrolase family protein [Pirellula sp.]|nr:amidohydrolase family protein [Pirellula sp.]
MKHDRRTLLKGASACLGALGLVSRSFSTSLHAQHIEAKRNQVGLPKDWRRMRKIDVHNHIVDPVHRVDANWKRVEMLIEAAESLGIEKLCCSRPLTGGVMAEIAEVREANDAVLAAMKRYPDRIAGFCFVQPGNGAAALDEIERCLEAGMIGVKLYNQFKYSDPMVFPVAEKCIARRIPLLGHSAHLTDQRTMALQPKTSDSLDFCQLSGRYPELMLILGHVNGGGDWEWAIKGLRECQNVFLDTSGSVLENDTIEMCVRELGHHRILFATDQTMEGCVGKLLSAEITPSQRDDIFWRNAQKILERRTT